MFVLPGLNYELPYLSYFFFFSFTGVWCGCRSGSSTLPHLTAYSRRSEYLSERLFIYLFIFGISLKYKILLGLYW